MKLQQLFLRTLFWLLFVIWSWLLLKEITPKPPPFPHFDKVVHITGFFILSYTAIKAYTPNTSWILACMAAYAASTEILQGLFTLTRQASALDFLADMCGVGLALLFAQLMQKTAHKMTQP